MSGWPVIFADCVAIGDRYAVAGQYADARIEYLKAASVAPNAVAETGLLECAWLMTVLDAERTAGETSWLTS